MTTSVNSSVAGFLASVDIGAEQSDVQLRIFFQQLVSGVTVIPGTLVFPRWQEEPPLRPNLDVDWAAIGVQRRSNDVFAYVAHDSTADGNDIVYRNQLLYILCSFYGPNCERNAESFSMGMQVAQNREALQQAGMGLVEVEDTVTAGDLLHNKWVTRTDVPFSIRRAQEYRYSVLNLVGAQVQVQDGAAINNNSIISSGKHVSTLPLFGWGMQNGVIAGWGTGSWR